MIIEKRFFIERNLSWGGDLCVSYAERLNGKTSFAKPIELEVLPSGHVGPQPMMMLDDNASQQLMDQLWIAGVRPRPELRDPLNTEHMNGEINWLRDVADHLMKRK